MNNEHPKPNPERIFSALWAYQQTRAMEAAVQLDLFTAIGEDTLDAEETAKRIAASERGTRVLCDFLSIHGFLKKEDGRYSLTLDAATFLNRNSPAYLGGTLGFLLSPALEKSFDNLAEVVRRGGTLMEGEGTVEPDHPIWVEFARNMAPLMRHPAQFMSDLIELPQNGSCRILDIAAGHGLFGIAFAKKYPLAEVVAVDWANVLRVATENASLAGVAARHQRLEGDAFTTEWGNNYQLILATNFFHHFDLETCQKLMAKMYRSLNPGGRVLTLEFVPNPDRVTPEATAAFSMTMLGTTRSGDAYTFAEYQKAFAEAGFSKSELFPIPDSNQQVIVSQKTS